MKPEKTALYDVHEKSGAKIVEFGGYLMPVQYRGIMDEHRKVRESVGIFDVSHMGEFIIKGDQAQAYLQSLTLNDVTKLVPHKAQYTAMCYENGGIVDDFILYRFPEHYLAIVNASNRNKDFEWMRGHLRSGVELTDVSDQYTLLAVQGRNAEATLQKLTDLDLTTIKFYWFQLGMLNGVETFFSRTGYTGEEGFEIGFDARHSEGLWQALLEVGREFEIEPIGLAARDTLRMEMKYPLYGNDIDQTTNPLEAGLGWITKLDKGAFIGRDVIVSAKENGVSRKLVGFEAKERAVPRQGYTLGKDGEEVGRVTSGTFSPSLEKGIGIGYVDLPYNEIGTSITISMRGKSVEAEVVRTPFYQRPY